MANSPKQLMANTVASQTLPRAGAGAAAVNDADDYVRPPARPLVKIAHDKPPTHPQQVHISVVGANMMRISWVTDDRTSPSVVDYGTSPANYTSSATGDEPATTYTFGSAYTSGAIHHVTIGPLLPATTHYYRCGGEGAGEELGLRTPPVNLPVEFVVIGDIGQTEWTASTLAQIGEKDYDVALLAGDLSYADCNQPLWDNFGRLVHPLASAD
uniref:Purple acid phosphatase N-terminal domain-containing protein n=1 Tax=Leersia perrieri TaxID=77586 RepID=A0A0D9XWY5_9ORYZ